MKKEIEKLLKSNGELKLNKIAKLKRWQLDGVGNKVDKLSIEFSLLYFREKDIMIEERNYKDIVNRVIKEQKIFLDDVDKKLTNNLKAGYLERN